MPEPETQRESSQTPPRNLSQTISPEAAGFDPARLARLEAYLQGVVAQGSVAGLTMLLARRGQIVSLATYGVKDLASREPMATDTIFRLFSMSKPLIGVAMMILFEEGKWRFDQPVSRVIPEFKDLKVLSGLDSKGEPILEACEHAPTMGELISHTGGFPRPGDPAARVYVEMERARGGTNQDMIRAHSTIPLAHQPGTSFLYGMSVDIQGAIIERLSGQTLGQFMEQRVFRPLNMVDTGFRVPSEKAGRLATLYVAEAENGPLEQAKTFSFGETLPPWERESAGAGLFSTTMDYARFVQMLANKGELDGARLLAPATVELMGTNMIPRHLLERSRIGHIQFNEAVGLGLDVMVTRDPRAAGGLEGKGTIDWGGSGRTWWWMDPENDITVVLMSQRLGGDRPEFQRTARTLTYQPLTSPDR